MSNNPQRQIVEMDGLRGIAVLVVLIGHTLPNYFPYNLPSWAWSLGVPLFFAVSGFCITYSLFKTLASCKNLNTKEFFLKRFRRIYPPYFVCFLIFFIKVIISEMLAGKELSFVEISKMLFFNLSLSQIAMGTTTVVNPAFWSLCVEFQYYLLTGFLIFISNEFPQYFKKLALLILAGLVSFFVLVNYNVILVKKDVWFMALPKYTACFLVGILLSWYKVFSGRDKSKNLFYLCLALSLLFIVLSEPGGILIFLLLIFATLGSKNNYLSTITAFLRSGFLVFFGERSYSIYLMHGFGILYLSRFAKQYFHNNVVGSLFLWILSIVFAVVLSILFYELIEKRFIRSVSQNRKKNDDKKNKR